ncbi:hypothetical protein [Campylobacter upsaliensis]|uniref:hypothetical protein n=1 Tax=Campylobacter upsaliensis TaxID=28080 RepID=UPI0022EA2FDF|nr:hypothetical protein [Campylobacter upsaliensis]
MKVFLGLILSIFVLSSYLYAEEKENSDKALNKSDKLIDRATDKFLNKLFN